MNSDIFQNILKYCSGCGACAYRYPNDIQMKLDAFGMYKPLCLEKNIPDIISICPFSGVSDSEDKIGDMLYKNESGIKYHKVVGYYRNLFAGYIQIDSFRENGSSGGFTTWILEKLLEDELIDGVIHVSAVESNENEKIIEYSLSFTKNEIRSKSKSKYYPIEFSQVLKELEKYPTKKFAFIGVPCFIKALRLLQKDNPFLYKQIPFLIGLVCGHLKSTSFAKSFAWQSGINPHKIKNIDFRYTEGDHLANLYSVKVIGECMESNEEKTVIKQNCSFFGYLWGEGFFKYNACDYCDDVFAETADLVLGDAWLPKYVSDPKGTNVIIIRNKQIEEIIYKYKSVVKLDILSIDDIKSSQDAGYRHKREYLAYRLYQKKKKKEWYPNKRIIPNSKEISKKIKKLIEYRGILSEKSHIYFTEAMQRRDFFYFKNMMEPLLKEYYRYYISKPYYVLILNKYYEKFRYFLYIMKCKLIHK